MIVVFLMNKLLTCLPGVQLRSNVEDLHLNYFPSGSLLIWNVYFDLFHIILSSWSINTPSPEIIVYSFLQSSLYISKCTIKKV